MLLERDHQPVDHGPGDAQSGRDLGDGHPVGGVGQELKHGQSAIEGLRGLGRHDATACA